MAGMNTSFLMALLLRPLVQLLVLGLICLPARLAVQRYMKEGKLKRTLLTRIGEE
jgi:hypothetical protein